MWKKITFGLLIGVMLLTVSAGVIYGAQINPGTSAANSINTVAGNGKGNGNLSNQGGNADCDSTGECTEQNCTGDCDGTGDCIGQNLQNQNNYKFNNYKNNADGNKAAGCGYASSGEFKYTERYEENSSFRNMFTRMMNFFKSRSGS